MKFIEPLRASGINRQSPEQTALVDAVLLDIWLRGTKRRSRFKIIAIVVVSRIVSILLMILFLPYNLAMCLPEIVFSLISSLLIAEFMDQVYIYPIFALWIAIFIFIKRDVIIHEIREVLFDIFDVLFIGSLTKLYIYKIGLLGPKKYLFSKDNKFELFMNSSRSLGRGTLLPESDSFLDIVSRYQLDMPYLMETIEAYWANGRESDDYWQMLNANEHSRPKASLG